MDVPVQNSFFHAYSFKRVCFFILVFVITLIAALGTVALMVIFVLKPERPIFSVQTLNLESYKLDVYSNSTLFISSVVSLRLNAQNPNKVGLRYSRSRLGILNQGLVIGLVRVPDFFQPPHSTNVSVSTRVLFQCLNVSQILSTHGIAKKMRISGDIKVYVRLFRITLPKVKVALDCDINIDDRYLTYSSNSNAMLNNIEAVKTQLLTSSSIPATFSNNCSIAFYI